MVFTVNDVEVIFMPEDRAYREAFGTLVCELDAMQEGLYRTQKKCRPGRRNAGRKSYEVFTSMDTEMRVKLDALLGGGICKAIFGTTPVMASADHAPLWFNLVEGLYSSMAPAERPKDCDAVIMKYRTKRIARKKIS